MASGRGEVLLRFDDIVVFYRESEPEFNKITGDYEVGQTDKQEVFANVTNLGLEQVLTMFGSLDVDAKTVRIQDKYDAPFDFIEIEGVSYRVQTSRLYRGKQTFIVRER